MSAYILTLLAECGPLGALFHWTHSYGYLIHYGAYKDNSKCKFFSQGGRLFSIFDDQFRVWKAFIMMALTSNLTINHQWSLEILILI